VLAVFVFAGGFVAGRLYYEAGGIPADVVALRYGVAAVFLLPYAVSARRRLLANPGWLRAAGLTLVGGAPFGMLVLTGVAGAPIAHGAGIVPAVALTAGTVVARVFLRDAVSGLRLLGLSAAIAGIAALILPALSTGDATWWGELAYVGAGVFWGSFTAGLRALNMRPADGTALVSVLSLPFLAVYGIWLDPQLPSVPLPDTIGQAVYQGIVFQIGAVMLYSRGVAQLGAMVGVAAMALMPGFGTLMEWAIFARVPFWQEIPAILLIASGVGIVAWSGMRTVKPAVNLGQSAKD
jgi:drug/metabolite transporter (DMT)-like permease